MIRNFALLLLLIVHSVTAFSKTSSDIGKILIEVQDGYTVDLKLLAIDRIREYSGAITHVVPAPAKPEERADYDMTLVLGAADELAELREEWSRHPSAEGDSWLLYTASTEPLVVYASGHEARGILYAAYRLADLIKQGADLTELDLFYQPKIKQRYVSFGTTTHGRRYHQPSIYGRNLRELPRYGYNGVLIYPGGGTPIARRASPVLEAKDGNLYNTPENIGAWKSWFREVDKYGLDILMTIPPMVPPGYSDQEIRAYYRGGPEPRHYIRDLKVHYTRFLEMLTAEYPMIDYYLFNSTEGATFGNNERFFVHPDLERYSNETYLANNEKVMKAYFDAISGFFKDDIDKVSFWTHSFGLTSDGVSKMREILFQYPRVLILEDDYWNNNLWPMDIPPMKFLPEDLRARIHKKNPFGMFQIVTDGEYYGGGTLPNAYVGSHIRSSKDALERDARMVIQRLDLHDRTPYGTLFGTMEIVPLVASSVLWDPAPSEDAVWVAWAERRFGKAAAPHVICALKESHNILLNGLSCNGMDLLCVGSEFAPRLWFKDDSGLTRFYLFSNPGRKLVSKTERDVIYSEEYTAFQMETRSIPIKQFRKNQQNALASVESGLEEIEKAKNDLTAGDYEMLNDIFENAKHVLTAVRLLGESAYATNLLLSNYDKVNEPADLFRESIQNLEQYISGSKLTPEMNRNLGLILANYKKTGESAIAE